MTPEQIESLRINLRKVSNYGLIQFLNLVLKEFHRRDSTVPDPPDPPLEPDLHNSYKAAA